MLAHPFMAFRRSWARRAGFPALLLVLLACGSDEGDGSGGPGGPGTTGPGRQPGAPGSALGTTGLENGGAGTDWHPDPDGDGVLTGQDKCPYVYDPDQADGNGDGVGDACDPAVDAPVEGGPINDLRAESVTPYGGWFTFRSSSTNQYGYSSHVAWSENATELTTAAGFEAAVTRGDAARMRVNERLGDAIPVPVVITTMKPGTTYYLAVRGDQDKIGKVVSIKTAPDPGVAPANTYPRVYATPAVLAELKARAQAGDAAFNVWKGQLTSRIGRAIGDGDVEQMKYCWGAALLHHATGEANYLTQAKALHGELVTYFEANAEFGGNEYRWADAALGICTDLLWNELDETTRNRSIAALLPADEFAAFSPDTDNRIDDTDEYQSTTRSLIINGLLACKAPGVPEPISARACKTLDYGMRQWFGVQAVQMKRDRGFFAMSGGHLPDGAEYQPGSSIYWMQTMWALHNAGHGAENYWPWITHNFAANYAHALTPKGKGVAAWGDIGKYADNWKNEPNSCSLNQNHIDLAALQMGLLRAAGRTKEAGWVRFFLQKNSEPDNFANRAHMLLFDTASLAEEDYKQSLSPVYFDSGFGIFRDRTSWSADASLLSLRGGWSGVDHSQEDQGHVDFYRRGRWLTHESIAYEGTATQAPGHNVLQLETLYNNDVRRIGQYGFRNNGPARVVRQSSGSLHSYSFTDLTGMYQSGFTAYYAWEAVQRGLVWLKSDEKGAPDTLVFYDLVKAGAAAPAKPRVLQFHVDAAPQLNGSRASLEVDGVPTRQHLDVSFLLPSTATVTTKAPDGQPGNSSDAIYTHRLLADGGSSGAEARFVTVLQASDVGGAAVPAPTAVDAGDWVGAHLGDQAVLFPKAVVPWRDVEAKPATVTLPTAAQRVYWAGHVPGAEYTVVAQGTTVTATPGPGVKADRGGLLAFDVAADGVKPAYR